MRVYMQIPAMEDKAPRFYHFLLQQDLLGGWSLIKESGYQGSKGRVKQEHYMTREEAEVALTTQRDAQIKKGFRVVFIQGAQEVE